MISKSSETFWRPGGFGRTQKAHDYFFFDVEDSFPQMDSEDI